MAKSRKIQNSFTAGEWSPSAHARTDLPQYQHACKQLKNVIPLFVGGAYNRPGSFFEKALAAATNYSPRIIPFVVSQAEAYAVVLSQTVGGAQYLKVYRPASNIARSTESSVTGAHEYKVATTNNANGYYDEVHQVQYAQSIDVMDLVHPLRKPKKLRRTATDTFVLADFDTDSSGTTLTGTSFREAWPYRTMNTTGSTMQINTETVGTGRTLTLNPAAGDSFRFQSTHVGAVFKVNDGGTYGCCKVTAYVSATQVTVQVIVAFSAAKNAVTTWWESSWSDYRGWPRSVCFFKQRIGYGGNATNRDAIWFSQKSNFAVMSVVGLTTSVEPGDGSTNGPTGLQPFEAPLASLQLNVIQWMSAKKTLAVGTMGEEWIVDSADPQVEFGCNNITAYSDTAVGSHHLQAQRVGNELMFVQQNLHEVQSILFNQSQSSYQVEPMQVFYDEKPQVDLGSRFNKRYRRIAWDETRKTLWCCDTYGNLFALTHNRGLSISAWTSQEMGGWSTTEVGSAIGSGGDQTIDPIYVAHSGAVLDIAVIPNPVIGFADIWLVVKRKINGAFQYHIERLIGGICPFGTAYGNGVVNTLGMYQADSCVYEANNYPSAEDNIFNGDMSHLEGKTPEGMIAGRYGFFSARGSAISSGSTTFAQVPSDFNDAAYGIGMGLPFTSVIAPLRIEAGSQIGSAQTAKKRIHSLAARFYRTQCAKIGDASDNTETVIFRDGDTALNKSAELYSGDKVVNFAGDYDRDGLIYIERYAPLPFAVSGIVAEANTYD